MQIGGSRVLLTGATGGIGHAIARALHARGAQLVLTGRRSDVLAPLAEEVGATAVECDLGDRDAVARLAAEHPDVDVLVNNAALPASGDVLELGVDDLDRGLEVNLRAPVVLSRLVAEQMAARGKGHLVFISSLAGKSASPSSALYSATKFGLRGYALGLRADLRAHGIGVSTVFPGFIREAGMFADSGAELPRGVGTRTPADVAAAVVQCIERNRAEVDVAPASLRVGASISQLAPELSAQLARRLGSEQVSAAVAKGQVGRR